MSSKEAPFILPAPQKPFMALLSRSLSSEQLARSITQFRIFYAQLNQFPKSLRLMFIQKLTLPYVITLMAREHQSYEAKMTQFSHMLEDLRAQDCNTLLEQEIPKELLPKTFDELLHALCILPHGLKIKFFKKLPKSSMNGFIPYLGLRTHHVTDMYASIIKKLIDDERTKPEVRNMLNELLEVEMSSRLGCCL